MIRGSKIKGCQGGMHDVNSCHVGLSSFQGCSASEINGYGLLCGTLDYSFSLVVAASGSSWK